MRIVLFFFFCITFINVKAQYKTMFPVDSITFEMIMDHSDGTYLDEYLYIGETITVDTLNYKIVKGLFEIWIREDTISGKTWLRNGETEVLIMDLNFEVGDTIEDYWTDATVQKVDTTGDRKIIEFTYEHHHVKLRYIEGIGCTLGFPRHDFNTLCKVYHNDSLVYAFDSLNLSCPVFGDIYEFDLENILAISPNPVSSQVQIVLKEPSLINSNINLYNIEGKLLLQTKLNSIETKIDLSSFQPQLLIADINKEDVHYISKVLKQ